jgi:hypothetical protein
MTSRAFCYWLQGYFELSDEEKEVNAAKALTVHQTDLIRRHLAMVFAHEIDPEMGGPAEQKTLNDLHDPLKEALKQHNKMNPYLPTKYRC